MKKGEEAGVSDLTSAIGAIGDRYLTISRKEAADWARQSNSLPSLLAHTGLWLGGVCQSHPLRFLFQGSVVTGQNCAAERYFAKVGALLLNDDYLLLPAAEVRRRKTALLRFTMGGPIFLRPARADKPFSGIVVHTPDEIEQHLEKVRTDDLIVLAPAREIEAEYRW